MIRMKLKENRSFDDKRLYIGPAYSVTAGEFGHVLKDKAHVFQSWEEGKFATSEWVNKCFPLSGFSLYEPEEVT